eukprot:873337-Pelagomonas_calceolata.AAC.2
MDWSPITPCKDILPRCIIWTGGNQGCLDEFTCGCSHAHHHAIPSMLASVLVCSCSEKVLRITVSKSGGAQLLQLTRNFGCPELSCLCINRVEVRKGCHRGASTQPIHVSQIRHVGSCHPSKPFVKCIELLCLHLLKILLLVLVVLQGVSRHAPSSHPQLIISSILGRMQHLKCMSARLGILLPHPHVKAQPDALSILCCPTFPTPEIIPGRHV